MATNIVASPPPYTNKTVRGYACSEIPHEYQKGQSISSFVVKHYIYLAHLSFKDISVGKLQKIRTIVQIIQADISHFGSRGLIS